MRQSFILFLEQLGHSPSQIDHEIEKLIQKAGELIEAGYHEEAAYDFTRMWYKLELLPAHYASEILYILGTHRTLAKTFQYGSKAIDDLKECYGDKDIRVTGDVHQSTC